MRNGTSIKQTLNNIYKFVRGPFIFAATLIPLFCIEYTASAFLDISADESIGTQVSKEALNNDSNKITLRISAKSESMETAAAINTAAVNTYSIYRYRRHYNAFVSFDTAGDRPYISIGDSKTPTPLICLAYFSEITDSTGYQIENSNIYTFYDHDAMVKANGGSPLVGDFVVISESFANDLIAEGIAETKETLLGKKIKIAKSTINGDDSTSDQTIVNIYRNDVGDGPYIKKAYGDKAIINGDAYAWKKLRGSRRLGLC
jgi:hypothetical protein